jgi:hypothetical protein
MAPITVRARRACKALGEGSKLERSLLVPKTAESEKKTSAIRGSRRYLTQKAVRSQKRNKPLKKKKHGATFAALENNPVAKKRLTDAKTTRSDALFPLTVAERADLLPTPANSQQWSG